MCSHGHILAAVHFHFNLQGDIKHRNADHEEQSKVTYPKFKNGEAVVRNARVSHNYGNTCSIYYFLEISDSDRLLYPIDQHFGGDDEDTVESQYDKVLREWQMRLL